MDTSLRMKNAKPTSRVSLWWETCARNTPNRLSSPRETAAYYLAHLVGRDWTTADSPFLTDNLCTFECERDAVTLDVTIFGNTNPDGSRVTIEYESEFEEETDATLSEFNEIAATAAADHEVLVADGFTPMLRTAGATTHMLDARPDIHPLPIGYDILAGALLEALG